MEDKKVMQFINDNYKKEHEIYLKKIKLENKKEKIKTVLYILTLIIVLISLILCVNFETKKSMKKCTNKGYNYNYCLRSL